MTDKVRIDTVDAHKSNETYLARQAEFESNVRTADRCRSPAASLAR